MSFHGQRARDIKAFFNSLPESSLDDFVYLESHHSGDDAHVTNMMRIFSTLERPERIVLSDARLSVTVTP